MKASYFAQSPTDEIANEIYAKVLSYRDFLRRSGRLDKLRTSSRAYYPRSVSITNVGEYGEF